MDVEKNFTSALDREENKRFSFGRRETQKIAWSDNPPIKVTLFWSRHESKKGHWNGTLCLEKLKDTGSKENHGRDGLTASRKQLAYDWKT